MSNKQVDVPASAADESKDQSISSADQKGNVTEAQPVVDSGSSCGTGFWTGDGLKVRFQKIGE